MLKGRKLTIRRGSRVDRGRRKGCIRCERGRATGPSVPLLIAGGCGHSIHSPGTDLPVILIWSQEGGPVSCEEIGDAP